MAKETLKTWRMSEREFYNKLDNWLKTRIEEVWNLSSTFVHDNQVVANRRYSEATSICSTLDAKRRAGIDLVCMDMNFWSDFSLNPQPFEDIVFFSLINVIFNTNIVCISYMCGNNAWTEEELEDLMFIYSGMFSFSYWDDEHVKIVCDMMAADDETAYIMLREQQFNHNIVFAADAKALLNGADKNRETSVERCQKTLKSAANEYIYLSQLHDAIYVQKMISIVNSHVCCLTPESEEEDLWEAFYNIQLEVVNTFKEKFPTTDINSRSENMLFPMNPITAFNNLEKGMPKHGSKAMYTYLRKTVIKELDKYTTQYKSKVAAAKQKMDNKGREYETLLVPKFALDDRLDWKGLNTMKLGKMFIRKYDRLIRMSEAISKMKDDEGVK